MKFQCDVCEKEEATIFCSADEAALCHQCDRRVHHANKLAGKHLRFSLLSPSFNDSPRCDICQERRGLLFCQEDRAILCRECDIPIHKANQHTQMHNRFLLSGIKVSAVSSTYQTSSSSQASNVSTADTETDIKSSVFKSNSTDKTLQSTSTPNWEEEGSSVLVSTSSISEYLMETLPGWHVDDFLDPSSSPYGFCKAYDHMLPFQNFECNLGSLSSEHCALRVPLASYQSHHLPQTGASNKLITKGSEEMNNVTKASWKLWSEDGFDVPRINPPFIQKSRQFS